MHRHMYLKYPRIYHALTFLRMNWLMLIGKRDESAKIITEVFNFVPIEGHTVKLTWLPSPINTRSRVTNCYIGSKGVAEDVKEDGSFTLKMRTGVLVVGKRYKFDYINSTEYHNG